MHTRTIGRECWGEQDAGESAADRRSTWNRIQDHTFTGRATGLLISVIGHHESIVTPWAKTLYDISTLVTVKHMSHLSVVQDA